MNAREAALYEEFKELLTKAYYGQAALVAEKEKLESQLEKIENKLSEKSEVKDLMENKKYASVECKDDKKWLSKIISDVTKQYQSKLRQIKKTRAKTTGTALEKLDVSAKEKILLNLFEKNEFKPMAGKDLRNALIDLKDDKGAQRRVISGSAALSQWFEPLKLGGKAVVDQVEGKPTRGKKYVPKEMGFVKDHLADQKKK